MKTSSIYKTYRNNHFIGNNQTITGCIVRMNHTERVYGDRDYRVANIEICLNGSVQDDVNSGMKISNIKIFSRDEDNSWYIQLPGSFRRTKKFPDGKRFDDVRFTDGQFAQVRHYCYDRVNEELDLKADQDIQNLKDMGVVFEDEEIESEAE